MKQFFCLFLAASVFSTEPPKPIFPLKDVRAGQRGYGLTVFQGTQPERFDFEVISVMRQFLPKQDLILIRMKHPVTDEAGIIAGMSGSPVYIDNRLVGAVAYGFPFTKGPIAGVTPIENMLGELHRPARGPERTHLALGRWLDPPRYAQSSGLARLALPLSAAGFPESVVLEMEKIFAPWHLQPLQGGGTGDGTKGPIRFEPGAALGVQLLRGDVSLVGTGTVTHVEGSRVVAFGHPMFGAGEIYLPITAAEIHMVIPSVMRSFKLASPLRELGTMVQDRQAAITGDTAQKISMLPMRLEVETEKGHTDVFHVELVRHRFLTPMLATTVALSGVRQAASDVADAIVRIRGRLDVRGRGPLVVETRAFSRAGIDAGLVASSRPMEAISALLSNRFEPAALERIDLFVSADYRSDFAEIEELRLPNDEVDPGSRFDAEVVLRPYAGGKETVRVPVDIPRALAGQTIKLVAASGSLVEPERAAPESLSDLIVWLGRDYPDDAMVLSVYSGSEGVALRGSILPDLPTSVLDVLRPGASSRRGLPKRAVTHVVVPNSHVVIGRAEVDLKVRKELLH